MLDWTIKLTLFVFIAFLFLARTAQQVATHAVQQPTLAESAAEPSPATLPAPNRSFVATARTGATSSALDAYRIPADAWGGFSTNVLVNGQSVKALVDTGAAHVSIRSEDAEALGIYLRPEDFNVPVSTANGVGHMASVKLREVQLGSILLYDVDALVGQPGALRENLLGMTFLSRLSRVEMDQGALVLRR